MPPGETGGDGTPTLPCINSSVVHVEEEMEPPLVVVDMMRSKSTKKYFVLMSMQLDLNIYDGNSKNERMKDLRAIPPTISSWYDV